MNIKEFKLGNLIKINPREKEEGILFLTDIQQSSLIGEMIIPRQGYHFRIQFNEALPLEISGTWLTRLGFSKSLGDIWIDPKNFIKFKFSASESGFLEDGHIVVVINSMHELQNGYLTLTGEKLTIDDLVESQ